MPTIYVSGGIGNQLFHTAFGHYINLIHGDSVTIKKLKLNSGLPHTRLSFFEFDYGCEHCEYRIHEGFAPLNELVDPWVSRILIGERLSRKFQDYRNQPFIDPTDVDFSSTKSNYLGYFQNKAFVQPIQSILFNEFFLELSNRVKTSIGHSTDMEVIHIRQGDTNTPANKKRVGVLSETFYKNILSRNSELSHRVVITDDVEGAKQVLQGISVDEIFGPRELDPWQSLHLMAQSKRLIMANSTFSWWGGFLALFKGAEVIIPEPFFNSPRLDTRGALNYPGFSTTKSYFIE